jgi:ubiquinone/menaquinone biosynthesis C-methylase UbiE
MIDAEVTARMREDWNARAREDAGYYVAFGQRDQDNAGFLATASEVLNGLETEMRRMPAEHWRAGKALEIGCGPGRLMLPMSRHFAAIHGVDVSDEMIALAREKLQDVPNAFPRVTSGASLDAFDNDSIDFVYSYAVFQHIPSRDVVYEYMREIRRVLKPDGFARLQFNGLPREEAAEGSYNTWAGARFSATDILEFTRQNDFQVLVLEGAATQYMWTTWRKKPPGWQAQQQRDRPAPGASIRRITNASSSEPVAPSRGRFAAISVWTQNLPESAGLHQLKALVDGSAGTATYIGPADHAGLQQVNVLLPEVNRTGLLPVELSWMGQRLCAPATLRVIPAGPLVPRVESVSDGVNLVAKNRIETRLVKLTLEEVARPEDIRAAVGGFAALDLAFFCVDPRIQRYEVNFRLPDEIGEGQHVLEVSIGPRKLAPVFVEVIVRSDRI